MDDRYKKLIEKLSAVLRSRTFEFLHEHCEDDDHSNYVMNVILSSHMTSLGNCMLQLCSGQKRAEEFTRKLLSDMEILISKLDGVTKVERMSS